MHELSIAMSIIEMAEAEAKQRDAQVSAVHLRLGALSGVVKRALLSAYELAREETILKDCSLLIEEVPIVAYCATCQTPRTPASMQWFVCPECKGTLSEILHGKELEVVALEIKEKVVPP